VTSHGALSVSGLVSLAVGAMLLFHNTSGFHTSLPLVVTVAVLLGSFWAFALTKAVQVRRRPVTVGPQEILGMHGVVRDGLVAVRGELWQARSATDEPLVTGDEVVVERLDGLTLVVRPAGKPASVA
jgi:membrane-bound serine protease (ClpP class)